MVFILQGGKNMLTIQSLSKQYIGGIWKDGEARGTLTNYNPYSGDVLSTMKIATVEEVD